MLFYIVMNTTFHCLFELTADQFPDFHGAWDTARTDLAPTRDGTGGEFDSWQSWIYIISPVHKVYHQEGPFGVL